MNGSDPHRRTRPGAVIFDMDDTLVHGRDPDTGEDVDVHYLSWRTVMGERGETIERDEYLAHMKGLDNAGCEAYMQTSRGIPRSERVAAVKERCYRERIAPRFLRVRDGVPRFLAALRQAGAALGVLTNAPRANLEATYGLLDLAALIERGNTLAADELAALGIAPKPAPEGLLHLAGLLGARPRETVYVGDSRADMLTARGAGIAALGITANYTADHLLGLGAGAVFGAFDELSPASLGRLLVRE